MTGYQNKANWQVNKIGLNGSANKLAQTRPHARVHYKVYEVNKKCKQGKRFSSPLHIVAII